MPKPWTPPLRWVFLAATLLGLFSTLQAYRLTLVTRGSTDVPVVQLLTLNLTYWYVPLALTYPILRLAQRFRFDTERWLRALLVHAFAALAFSMIDQAGMLAVRAMMWDRAGKPDRVSWSTFVQARYLEGLDRFLMTYAAIVGVGFLWESKARALKAAQLETQLAEARLKTLEAQLHPHFLFNTLHAISTLLHTRPDSADRMISRLSDLLRLTFNRSDATGVSLQEELEFLQKYLEIEQTRFHDRLSVMFHIDPEVLDAEVPRLILQPLVENAIKHGISPRSGPGLVQISASRAGDRLSLEVRDDGVGLSAAARTRLHSGVGLTNTRDRLACLYGAGHRLDVSDGSEGLSVRIEIPFHRVPSDSDRAASRVA